jgi:hypothetical protein
VDTPAPSPDSLPSTPSLLVGMLRLYVPLALVCAALVAAPTLLAGSTLTRLLAVLLGGALVLLLASALWRAMARRPWETGSGAVVTQVFSGPHELKEVPAAEGKRFMRDMERMTRVVRLLPLLALLGLVAGALLGAATGSFLLTVLLGALGLLAGGLLPLLPALRLVRRLQR